MMPQLVTAQDVVDAVLATIRTYLPNVLPKVGDGTLLMPVSYARPSTGAARLDAAACPVVSVSVIGSEGVTEREQGYLSMRWSLDVMALVRSADGTYESTMRDGALYAAALFTVLTERGDLGGIARDTYELAESYDDADPTAGRTLAEVHVTGVVHVTDARRRQIKFTLPGVVPATPIATTTTVTVHK